MLEAEIKNLRNNISAVASDLLNYKTLNQGRGLGLEVFGIFNNMINLLVHHCDKPYRVE